MDMDISMDIHEKSVDMDMDVIFHIHGNPANRGGRSQHISSFSGLGGGLRSPSALVATIAITAT